MNYAGTLGQPYKIAYLAKNFATGLLSISAKIIRPDGAIFGPFYLTEVLDSDLNGVYCYDFETQLTDPAGSYIVIINNPEQGHKEGFRINYQLHAPTEAISNMYEGLRKNYFGE